MYTYIQCRYIYLYMYIFIYIQCRYLTVTFTRHMRHTHGIHYPAKEFVAPCRNVDIMNILKTKILIIRNLETCASPRICFQLICIYLVFEIYTTRPKIFVAPCRNVDIIKIIELYCLLGHLLHFALLYSIRHWFY